MKQIFRSIGKGLGEYFLATETRKFFKERGDNCTIELIFGKYIPNIMAVGSIAASSYFHEPQLLCYLIGAEALRIAFLGEIANKKENLEDRLLLEEYKKYLNIKT